MDKVQHFEIPADDTSKAEKFYTSVFGWDTKKVDDFDYIGLMATTTGEDGRGNEVNAISGGMFKRDTKGMQPIVVISVDNIKKALEKIEKQGGKTVLETQNIGEHGLYARFEDIEGNILGLWETVKK
ncbi:VOC family protein [Candidatus Woesearchaeota archaeon]|nr:VOC family protein [Candidatus Woesearchaeota archaeon]